MTWEPLTIIISDSPYSCAVYAKKFELLNMQGWKQLKRHARTAERDLSGLLRNPSTDKPRHPADTSMDGVIEMLTQ